MIAQPDKARGHPRQAGGYVLADAARWTGLIGILAIAVLRCLTVFAPQALFDTDPAQDNIPLGGLAQAGSLWLDVILLASCALAVLGEWRSGRRLSHAACLFASLPLIIVWYHGLQEAGDLWRGATWSAAAIACVTVAHLARDRRMRIIIAAILLATIAPLIVRGVGQATWEHTDTVRTFDEKKVQFFQERGWSPDSSAAKIFERRLRQPQPTGWFTTSNIFASVMVFGLIALLGLAIAAAKARLESGWVAAMGLCAIAAAALLMLTGSKGAMLAALAGLTLALAPLVIPSLAGAVASRLGGLIIIALVLLTLGAVAIRGTALPEGFAGDKSLLFRWHYTVASARMIAENPGLGVGPDGFQDAYPRHRLPRNPEEVQSAHSMFWDWITALGIPAGACWIALVMMMLYRSALPRRVEPWPIEKNDFHIEMRRLALRSILVIAATGMLPMFLIEGGILDPMSVLTRVLGVGGFVAISLLAAHVLYRADESVTRWCFAAAAIALVIHGQIEMTFHQAGSVVWAMCGLGLAGSLDDGKPGGQMRRRVALLWPCLILIAAGGLALAGAIPATQRERAMSVAAQLLRSMPHDADAQIAVRRHAADALAHAYHDISPHDPFLLEASARQLLEAGKVSDPSQRVELLRSAAATLTPAIDKHRRPSSIGMAINLHRHMATLTNDVSDWNAAIDFARQMTDLDPHGLSAWKQYADTLWDAGRRSEAIIAYRRALECDANFELDELKRLAENDRAVIQQRAAE